MKVVTNQRQGIRRDRAGEGVGGLHGKVGKRQTVGTNNCDSCADVACGATTRRFPRQECGTKSAKRWLVLRSEAAQQQLLNPKPDPEAQPGTRGKKTLTSYFPPASTHAPRCPGGHLAQKANKRDACQPAAAAGPRHSVSSPPD